MRLRRAGVLRGDAGGRRGNSQAEEGAGGVFAEQRARGPQGEVAIRVHPDAGARQPVRYLPEAVAPEGASAPLRGDRHHQRGAPREAQPPVRVHPGLFAPRVVNRSRYEYIQCEPPSPRRPTGNPIATQKLHELLSTPKKSPKPQSSRGVLSPQVQRRLPPSPQQDPFMTPRKTQAKSRQKLNYALGTRQMVQQDKRHTAVVAPICSSPIQSVYSETTFSHKAESWMNIGPKKPTQVTLAVAAVMMTLCGGVTSGLCSYMMYVIGRSYFLDFGMVAGFTCLTLGVLGFRTRRCYWLPNRNYISGTGGICVGVS
jgi:hypothetical protein